MELAIDRLNSQPKADVYNKQYSKGYLVPDNNK